MEQIPGYSIYETILSSLSVFCSFGVKEDYNDELIKQNWIKLQKIYPYLYDYTVIDDKKDDYSNNLPIKIELKDNYNSLDEYLNKMISILSKQSIEPKLLSQKNSLLAYSKIHINKNIYTFFSLYTPHSRTDFKSIYFIVTTYLNLFDNITTIYPMESMNKVMVQKNLIPEIEEREDLIKKYFYYKNILKFDYKKLNENIILTEKEKEIIENDKNSYSNSKSFYMTSKTLKISKEEIQYIFNICKKNDLSIQGLLYAAFLKASLELFKSNINEADAVNFQIIYDQRKNTVNNEKCIGLFADGTYPCFSLDLLKKSVMDISKELTIRIRKVKSIDDEEFKRYRLECYHFHKKLYTIQFSLSASNMGKFKVLEDLSNNIKEKFVDFYFMGGYRFPLSNNNGDITIHMFGLFDGSCNISLSYPEHIIPSVYIKKLLEKTKEIMLNP